MHKSDGNTQKNSVLVNCVVFHDESDIADKFNMYFLSVAGHLAGDILLSATSSFSFLTLSLGNYFFLKPVTLDESGDIIANLKITSAKYQWICVKVIKLAKYCIAEPIYYLIHSSFMAGRLPEILKESYIMPIFKSGDHSMTSIYRPISTWPTLGKIFEKSMARRVLTYV